MITSSNAYNRSYGYDSNGNMTTRMDASVTYPQIWDAQNRLSGMTAPGKDTAWTYKEAVARVSKVNGPIVTVFVGGSVESLPRRRPNGITDPVNQWCVICG